MLLKKYPKEKKIFSVSELTSFIKIHLESKFPTLYVEGEVSNLSLQSSGHIYFTLKDGGASISCVMFRSSTRNGAEFLKHGKKICIVGSLRVYEPRGSYQIIASRVELKGQGDLFSEFEKRKADYENRGWFDSAIKKEFPLFPKKIAIITSPTGAVIKDFYNVVKRRQPNGLLIHLYPVRVQGSEAAKEIKNAIELINNKKEEDLIVIARGGGSIEDLWAFNEKEVVEAIFYSDLPIISAIGHETDFTLSDFVADKRASTPSVAGELVVSDSKVLLEKVSNSFKSLERLMFSNLEYKKLQLVPFKKSKLTDFFIQQIEKQFMNLDYLNKDLNFLIKQIVDEKKSQIKNINMVSLHRQMSSTIKSQKALIGEYLNQSFFKMDALILDKQQNLEIIKERLMAHSPEGILKKGYTLLSKNNECVYLINQLKVGEEYDLQLCDGKANILIKGKLNGKKK
ncbi:MAG: exodeoxyribonuclease VII large subunit [Candidatus Cloacimonadota bacterium]|nr:MAG: exodeoxyribonuclease VII large subunit [Candidatus Cloacimonadota bacterium]